jgi:hypothetical protein
MPSKPLEIARVPIDSQCVGDRWSVDDETLLAKLIAIVAMGQAAAAAHVLKTLSPAAPAFTNADLQREAKRKLTVQDTPTTPRKGYPRWQRDGFIFEVISWIAARQVNDQILLKDPHVSATSQGIDGLMLELSADKGKVSMTTVCEDKCTSKQRSTFVEKVMPAFMEHHQNKRAAEVVAAASILLRTAGVDDAAAARMSEAVMNRKARSYRAAFALTATSDSQEERAKLFKGFDQLDDIAAAQRIGAGLILAGKLRASNDSLAAKAIAALDEFPPAASSV